MLSSTKFPPRIIFFFCAHFFSGSDPLGPLEPESNTLALQFRLILSHGWRICSTNPFRDRFQLISLPLASASRPRINVSGLKYVD
ncbi:hypothetical protein B0H19DRAFT_1134026 [Mycena capillaripes]|nr:hypothetical protein B0H19DRAFT_1134026 [Mycena capillaripes]